MAKKILIIDDDQEDVLLMKEHLKRIGQEDILVSYNGEEGLEVFKVHELDLVICDITLPGMDGFEVCKEIKSFKKKISKVVLLTGNINAINYERSFRAGADQFLIKSPDFTYFEKAMSKILSGEGKDSHDEEGKT